MNSIDLRNLMVKGLYAHLSRPVVLSDQLVSESEYPYVYYQPVQPYIPRGGANIIRKPNPADQKSIITQREEWPDATYSIVACSHNRQIGTEYIHGDDEAQALADQAQGWFLHVGALYFAAHDITVMEVNNVQSRTALEIDELDRRYGFDVRLRYLRIDTRIDPTIDNGIIRSD